MFLFISVILARCSHKEAYRLPIYTYLDQGSVMAIARESGVYPWMSEKEMVADFLNQTFQEVNSALIQYGVHLQLSLKDNIHHTNFSLPCGSISPISTFMKSKNIDRRKSSDSEHIRLFIVYCDNFLGHLGLNEGIYTEYNGCRIDGGIMYVNNDILKVKIKDVLFKIVTRSNITHLGMDFERNLCQLVNECISGAIKPIGSRESLENVSFGSANSDDEIDLHVFKYDITAQQL
ncbi:hypothetical protein THOM_2994 [Trachipleistophora hominis]|uniref:Uncharacterized protein n=1 Tax=Trachipleistophora hominis TaxID=72359 RepID=L7JRJ8_TRAHO|nr:hypothetical protein THOM_2994 [Trachipleistophora hominis]